jgi:hypothetical protein
LFLPAIKGSGWAATGARIAGSHGTRKGKGFPIFKLQTDRFHQERKVHAVPRSSRRTLLKWLPNHPHTFPKITRDDRSYADARGFVIIAKADFP